MPRKKTIPEPESLDLFPDQGFDEITEAFDGLPSDEKIINLYRIKEHGRPPWLAKISPSQFDLAFIEEQWGGGRYKAIAKDKATGHRVEKDFEIDGEPIIRSVQSDNINRRTLDGKLLAPKDQWRVRENPNGSDPFEYRLSRLELMIEKLADRGGGNNEVLNSVVAPLIAKMVEGSANSEDKLLEKLALFKSILAPPSSSVDAQTIFGAVQKGMELIERGEGGGASPWLSLVKELLPTLQEVISKVAVPKGPGVMRRAPTDIPGQREIEPPPVPATGFASLAPMLRQYLPTFIEAASADDDPGFFASMASRRIPEDKKQMVDEWVKSGQWFPDIVSLDARIPAQKAWWEEFAKMLHSELSGEPIEPEPEGEM